jgi:hypothetical protein
MAKSYCLTIEVKSETIENGLGYMIGFSLPDERLQPAQAAGFEDWSERVKAAVLRAGDQVFDPDPYTRKLALAELMNELTQLNDSYSIRIGGLGDVPAVQIQSTNPYDKQIEVEFTGSDGEFAVTERSLQDLQRARVEENGRTGLLEGAPRHFPFTKAVPAAIPRKPAPRGPGF